MTHETENALRARIAELENGNAYLREVMERAESEASAKIAELQAVNSEQAEKIVDLQTRRREHLRTISDLMGKNAELVEALTEAKLQIEYLEGKFGKTGTGTAAIARIERIAAKHTAK